MGNTAKIHLDKWQEEVNEHRGNCLLCTGRQVGKTTIFAIKAAKRMVEKETHIVMASLTEDQAKLIIIMILDYLEKNYNAKICRGDKRPTQNKIRLRNGSTVVARPVGTTGNSFRGFTGDILYIDEASRMSELVWTASKPTLLTTGGEIWMSSTPAGKKGYFWESFNRDKDNDEGRFKVWHISSEKVINDRPITDVWTKDTKDKALKLLEEEKAEMSTLQYGQEYLGLFLDDLRQYFSDELIERVCVLKRNAQRPKDNLFLGVDIARLGDDATTYEVIHKRIVETSDGMKIRLNHVENIVKKLQLTTQTERDILYLNTNWDFNYIGIDAGAGSLGVGILDRLRENNATRNKTIAMNNRQISLDKDGMKRQRILKEDMYEYMLSMLERGDLQLLDDEDIKQSLKSVQWEIASGDEDKGIISKVRIFGKDTHIVEGLVRACYLAKERKVNKPWIHTF